MVLLQAAILHRCSALTKKHLGIYGVDGDSITAYIMDAGQTTVHFNVLRERVIDTKRIIIDEAAPLYHVCAERNYPPMHIIVSDEDIQNRLEKARTDRAFSINAQVLWSRR